MVVGYGAGCQVGYSRFGMDGGLGIAVVVVGLWVAEAGLMAGSEYWSHGVGQRCWINDQVLRLRCRKGSKLGLIAGLLVAVG